MAEVGDRTAFLAEARRRLAGPPTANVVHVPPAPTAEPPEVGFTGLDRFDLVASFLRAAEEVDAEVHVVEADGVGAVVVGLADRHGARSAVRTPEPGVEAAASALAGGGVAVEDYSPEAASRADLGLTGAVAAVAATGSVVLDTDAAGSRGAGLLPPVHVCVVGEDQLVATPADVFLPLSEGPPSSLVLVGGPSRTGDVEQILTLGVHGPRHVHVVLVRSAR
jgi:L-lactate utilization protein LutC